MIVMAEQSLESVEYKRLTF